MRLEITQMATSMFLTLSLDIPRTSWRMKKVSDGSFFWKFHALSFEPNLCWTRNSSLRGKRQSLSSKYSHTWHPQTTTNHSTPKESKALFSWTRAQMALTSVQTISAFNHPFLSCFGWFPFGTETKLQSFNLNDILKRFWDFKRILRFLKGFWDFTKN